ncbi:hypothetical protein BH09ACT4_BH09ACT4_18270 [soil metagenome]
MTADSTDLGSLADTAMLDAIDIATNIRVPFPAFVLVEDATGRHLHRFSARRIEQTVAQAQAFVGLRFGDSQRVVLTLAGSVTHEGKQCDALIVKAFDVANDIQFTIAQRYRRTGPARRRAALVGSPIYLDA